MEIRNLRENDNFCDVSTVYAESWREAYRGIVPADYLEELSDDNWVNYLEEYMDNNIIVIEEDEIVGAAAFGPSRDESLKAWGEVYSIYIRPKYFRHGYGTYLMKYILGEFEREGVKDIFIWVLEDNIRSQNFYVKNGFRYSGEVMETNIGGKEINMTKFIKTA